MTWAKKVGDEIRWTSQSAGTWSDKRCVVRAIVAGNKNLHQAIEAVSSSLPKPSHVKASRFSKSDRYLVEVRAKPTKAKPNPPSLWYGPLCKVVDNQLAKAATRTKRARR